MKKQFLLLLVLLSVSLFAQVPQSEKDALIALYNATDGSNWNNNTNWNTAQPVENWSGVTVENGHVTKLQLYNNNLTGTLPIELQNLPELYRLSISYNNLSGTIPDLTGLSNLTQFYIGMNYFQFADFENEVASYIANVSSFWYNRMKKIDTEINYDIIIGDDYTFIMSAVSGTGVTYQWYKNDEIISGETNLTYTITNAQITDATNYTCKASSSLVPDLQIERNTIHIYDTILPADKNDLMMLYYATDGANWINNTNWNTSAPVYEWYGVEVEGNRVKSINLNSNNLVGTLPTQIGDLDYLQRLSLDSNIISGTIPTEIGNLNNLTGLFLNYNQLSGTIPSSLGNLTALTDLEFWNNQLTGSIPSTIGNLINLKVITLEQNQLSGNIPSSFANLTSMTSFWLNDNQLTGNVDGIFDNMPDLVYISLANNQIEGNVDLSNNTALYGYWLNNNLLTSIDVKNGNNQNTPYFYAQNNPNLTCVFVDDSVWSTSNWTHIDTTTHFFETQQECDDFNAQTTYVPDNNFEQALIDLGYDDVMDDYVLTGNINAVTFLDVAEKEISDLTGIEDFTSLIYLSCGWNLFTELDVSSNTNLMTLKCEGSTLLESLNVTQNLALEYLDCYQNALSILNVSQNTSLNYLYCSNNQLTNLDVSHNSNLLTLDCSSNLLPILNTGNNSQLTKLICNSNQLTNIDISNNLLLNQLNVFSNAIQFIDVSQLTFLTKLQVENNQLISLNVSNGNNSNFSTFTAHYNPNLYCIQVDDYLNANLANGNYASWQVDSQITFSNSNCASQTNVPDNNFEQALIDLGYDRALDDYVPTSNINQITSLIIENKNISDITGIDDFTNLYQLACGYNPIGFLDVSNNTNLVFLACSQTEINSIDITTLSNLQNFYCSYNNLSNLDLSQNSNLKVFYCDHNQLNNLILSQNNLLEVFNCSDNNLTSLDVSNNLNLLDARGENNNLTSLDFSQNTLITKIDFYNNQLSFLDVRNGNNQIITSFYNVNNPNLTCIYVDDATWSTTNWTNIDSSSTFVETEADCTALATTALEIQNNLSVYPNPTTGILQIKNNTDNNINKIIVTNMLGQEVNVFENNLNNIDISHLPNAVYFINIFTEDNDTATYKIVKK